MGENPRENAMARRSPSELEAWARLEARSEAMVSEVLERAGAAGLVEPAGGRLVRGLTAFAAALALAAIVGGSLGLALIQLGRNAARGDHVGVDPTWTTANDEGPRFGSFYREPRAICLLLGSRSGRVSGDVLLFAFRWTLNQLWTSAR